MDGALRFCCKTHFYDIIDSAAKEPGRTDSPMSVDVEDSPQVLVEYCGGIRSVLDDRICEKAEA